MRKNNKTALITGSNRGLGLQLLQMLSANGYNVIACTRSKSSSFSKIIDEVSKKNNNKIYNLSFDLLNHSDTESSLTQFLNNYEDNVDLLINNAGILKNSLMLMTSIKEVEDIFKAHPGEIAAIFIEPLPANNGLLIQHQSYLEGLRMLCDQYDALLVFDEVISGFRIGFGGMAELTGITPDIVTYGKIIGGGFPVGAVAAKKEIMECLAPIGDVYQAGTLSANPVAMVAGLENCKQLTPEFYKDLENKSKNIVDTLKESFDANSFEDYQIIRYRSLFWAIPTQERILTPDDVPQNINERFYKLFQYCLERGVYLSPNAYEVGFASGAHDENVCKELKNRLCS